MEKSIPGDVFGHSMAAGAKLTADVNGQVLAEEADWTP